MRRNSTEYCDTAGVLDEGPWSAVVPFRWRTGGAEKSRVSQGTRAEGAIPKLFRGKMKSFIRCVNVNYEEYRIEEFDGEKQASRPERNRAPSELTNVICCTDIQLEVKGIKTLYDSFRDYVTVETLDGENKYDTKGFGLQDARKGTIFQSFPPVLHLHLKRFGYDTQLDGMVKVCITYILDELLVRF
jgi:ubiquitin carboxyl-terminal hydrolase 7